RRSGGGRCGHWRRAARRGARSDPGRGCGRAEWSYPHRAPGPRPSPTGSPDSRLYACRNGYREPTIPGHRAPAHRTHDAMNALMDFLSTRRVQLTTDSWQHVSATVQAVLLATVLSVAVGVAVHRSRTG